MIREAVANDVPVIFGFIRELADYERALDQVVMTEEKLARDLFGPDPRVFALIAEADGGPVGFALWYVSYSTWTGHGIYLEDLYVTPGERGGGYGRELLKALARVAVERGYARFEWSVLDWNEPALGFYKRLGAEPLGEWVVHRMSGEALRTLGGGEQRP